MVGYSDTISSGVIAIRSCQIATSETVMRCPAMRGLPPRTPGVVMMRSPRLGLSLGVSLVLGSMGIILSQKTMLGAAEATHAAAPRVPAVSIDRVSRG